MPSDTNGGHLEPMLGPVAPPAPLEDLVVLQVDPFGGEVFDELMGWLSAGAVYRREPLQDWLASCDEVEVSEVGTASLHPATADPIPIWQVTPSVADVE